MVYPEKKKYVVYKQEEEYKYYASNGKDEIAAITYGEFGRSIVKQWMEKQQQKINILYSGYEYAGCGVYMGSKPFRERKLPTAYVTAVFGGYNKD
jgi:hypothetical protein